MSVPRGEEPWVGRAIPPPPRDPWREPTPTAQFPVVPGEPAVRYVSAPRRPWALVVGLMLVAFVAGAVVAVMASPALRDRLGLFPPSSPSVPASPSETPTPSPTPTTPPPPAVGDQVADGSFQFVVTDVACGLPSVEWGFLSESADGQYCLVRITVTNTGRLPAALVPRAQHLHATDGSRHSADTTAGYIANHRLPVWDDVILPGHTASGLLVFDIPADVQPAAVELHDSPFSDGVTVSVAVAASPTASEG